MNYVSIDPRYLDEPTTVIIQGGGVALVVQPDLSDLDEPCEDTQGEDIDYLSHPDTVTFKGGGITLVVQPQPDLDSPVETPETPPETSIEFLREEILDYLSEYGPLPYLDLLQEFGVSGNGSRLRATLATMKGAAYKDENGSWSVE